MHRNLLSAKQIKKANRLTAVFSMLMLGSNNINGTLASRSGCHIIPGHYERVIIQIQWKAFYWYILCVDLYTHVYWLSANRIDTMLGNKMYFFQTMFSRIMDIWFLFYLNSLQMCFIPCKHCVMEIQYMLVTVRAVRMRTQDAVYTANNIVKLYLLDVLSYTLI